MQILILPSLLAADFGNLEAGARKAETSGADMLHLDIMDAHFVPNLSMGPDVVRMAKCCIDIPLNVHLMMTHPDQYLNTFIDAGADSLLIHIEADCDVPESLARIRELGARCGITLNPETPENRIMSLLKDVDEVLFMSVHPGYGGQAFMPEVLPKIQRIRKEATAAGNLELDILVDGGIDLAAALQCAAQGANGLIAGTSLYGVKDMSSAIAEMRTRAAESFTT